MQNTPLQRADDYKLFNFDFVSHILHENVTLEVVLKMFYGLNVVENFQVPVEVSLYYGSNDADALDDDDDDDDNDDGNNTTAEHCMCLRF